MIPIALLLVVLAPNVTPSMRDIGAHYHVTVNQSEIWMNLEPTSSEPGPHPLVLSLTVRFPGRQTAQAPQTVTIRAEANCFVFPTRIRQRVLRFLLDGRPLELTTSGGVQFVPGCNDDSGATAVVATVPFSVLREIGNARDAQLNALGFSTRLSSDDLAALRHYLEQLSAGVAIAH